MAALARPLRLTGVDGRRHLIAIRAYARPPSDLIALAALVALMLIAQPHLLVTSTLVSLDSASQFYPWYAFLGESLRAAHIPGWNPAGFSGTPFAANPLSGWTYLPAMLLFTWLPRASAAKAYLLFHPLLAAWSSYTLARAVGLNRFGAFVSALAYANSGFLQIQNSCCFAFAGVYAWLPLALLGAEGAINSTRWAGRAAWWGLGALAFSQIVAAWLGQGTYYAALMLGGYIAYRTLFVLPTSTSRSVQLRIACCLQHEIAIFAFGAALDAAGLLPRIEFISLSNLAGGYAGGDGRVGGLRPEQWGFLVTPGMWYVGASVLLLAVAAPFVACRRRFGRTVWYFGITSVIALILTNTFETPLDVVLYDVLPGFENLHPHAPERILTVAYLGPALLAGATISAVSANRRWTAASLSLRAAALALVVGLVTLDLAVAGAKARTDRSPRDPLDGISTLAQVDLGTLYLPSAAAVFLQQELAVSPSRFLGYAPHVDGQMLAYTVRAFDPSTANLLVNNRGVALALQDIQGYDASHLRRYDDYLAALNGQTQNYHNADVFPLGLSSALLNLLNARYFVVPIADHVDPADWSPVFQGYPQVYADQNVRILKNPSAQPRAWLVHAATSVLQPTDASRILASGAADGRQTAVLEEPPPPLTIPSDPSADRARVTDYAADELTVSTSTTASGLLVLSEVYYPAWNAYVDGQPTHLYAADGALRAVAVPPGEHKVEMRFESATLWLGVIISSIAVALLVVLELAPVAATGAWKRTLRIPHLPARPVLSS